ncbi:glycosyl hydrolase [Paenibacillus albidus]|uniref:Glycosyl hydrolase n=3 Tax=Paenibacillus albidus TaxID=2041023 RepID=A0A917C5L8_9BACL|nr:CARDB domain-containing protein [Paenibacillus albidus]GGF70119.1 glycosyl hydrolase [Paenibacillus albidus]
MNSQFGYQRKNPVFIWLLVMIIILSQLTLFPASTSAADGPNLALGNTVTASGQADVYSPNNVKDGNAGTYWESPNNAFPQWIQVDLGISTEINKVVLKLPAGWETRTQTLAVQGSTNGSTFTNIVGSNGYTFDPSSGNTVTINFAETSTRYVRLSFTANTGWPAGQLSEFEIYGPGTTPTPTPTPTATTTPVPTATATPVPTATATPVPTTTATPVPTTPPAGTNVAMGKAISASSVTHTYAAANANDNDVNTYWEGGSNPSTLTLDLGADYNISSVVLKLNPSPDWSTRTQTIQVLGHDQNTTTFSSLSAAKSYTFDPAAGNTVTIPVSAKVKRVQLNITSNSGAPAGQIAEFQVFGTAGTNPDLTVTGASWTPASPVESNALTLSATVKNNGTAESAATSVNFYLNNTLAGSAPVAALAAGASAEVTVNAAPQNAGTYTVSAKVDENNAVTEQNEGNNSFTSPSQLTVAPVSSADLIPSVSWNPGSPAAGSAVSFTVSVKNQGNMASTSSEHAVTVVLKNAAGATLQTLNGSYSGTIETGASVNVSLPGTWTATNGSYTVTATVAADANEVTAKRSNNSTSSILYIGRGANMPFTVIEAESASNTTNGTRLTPNYTLGDFAGEASGRSAVHLDAMGEYVEFTLTSPANAFVLRNAVAENTSGTVTIYANGTNKGKFTVNTKYSYLYATPQTLGRLGYDNSGTKAYWLYEDSQLLLDQVYPAGTKIRIQKDAGDVSWIYLDMIEIENVAPPASNPDPDKYVQVSASKSIEQALNEFRQDPAKKGIFIPAGEWQLSSKIFLYGRATEIIGAGPWHTKLVAPQTQSNTDVGFNISSAANGSVIRDLSAWGNYQYRVDGPGKFIDGNGIQNVTVQNTWVEHFVCLYWGVNSSNNTFKNNRIKNTFADGINMTNGSSNNVIDNNYARATGDDAFALFSAADAGGSYNTGNKYTNLTAVNVRRAAAFAIYGGSNNLFSNLYAADTLTYPGITINSYSFGYNTLGFGDQDTVFDGITLDRTGGDFWTSVGADDKINDYQNFGAIWFYAGDRAFKNIVVRNVDINNPVYFGLMFQTMYPNQNPMQNVRLENINVNNAPRYGIKLVASAEQGQGPVLGAASFTNVKLNNSGIKAIYGEDKSPGFNVIRVSGNNW